VDDSVFSRLDLVSAPTRVVDRQPSFSLGVKVGSLPQMWLAPDDTDGTWPPFSVVAEKRVAGLDATILAASDGVALAGWLSDRGFEMRESLRRWVSGYVAKGWYFVAFRYARARDECTPSTLAPKDTLGGDGGGVTTGMVLGDGVAERAHFGSRAVRISFATDEPVYPYLEPDDVPTLPGRSLTLHVVASTPMTAELTAPTARPWTARSPFVAPMGEGMFAHGEIPGVELPAHPWLTRFDDDAALRARSDLTLRAAPRIAEKHTFDHEHRKVPVYLPLELPLAAAGALVWGWRRRRRSSAGSTPA
jgi:hypothetical protein